MPLKWREQITRWQNQHVMETKMLMFLFLGCDHRRYPSPVSSSVFSNLYSACIYYVYVSVFFRTAQLYYPFNEWRKWLVLCVCFAFILPSSQCHQEFHGPQRWPGRRPRSEHRTEVSGRLLISNQWLALLTALWKKVMPPCKPHTKDCRLGTLSKFEHRHPQGTIQPERVCFNPEQHETREKNPGKGKQRDQDKPCSSEKISTVS